MLITGLFAGILGLIYLVLSVRVVQARRSVRVSLGDGGHETLSRRVRVHGNFIEYVPLALLMMVMLEAQGAHEILLYAMGGALVIGRIGHAVGLTRGIMWLRVGGMMLTFAVIGVASVMSIAQFFVPSNF